MVFFTLTAIKKYFKNGFTSAYTGHIGILTCNAPDVGDEVRVTGIFHTGTVGVQVPGGIYAGYHTSGSPPSIELISQTIIKKSGKVTVTGPHKATVYFFYRQDCPHCHTVMPFIQTLSEKYPDVDFQSIDITNLNDRNYTLFKTLNQKFAVESVPEVIIDGYPAPLTGDSDIQARLEGIILEQLK